VTFRTILVYLFFLLTLPIYGQPIILDSDFTCQKITTQSQYYEDTIHNLNPGRLSSLKDNVWQQVPTKGLAKPLNKYSYWVRFETKVYETGEYYLRLEFTQLDTLVLYIQSEDGSMKMIENLGDRLNVKDRQIQYRVPTFRFHLKSGDNYWFYLYGYPHHSICMMPIYLHSELNFIKFAAKSENTHGFMYGLLFGYVLIAFLTWLYFRETVYLYYCIHIIGFIIYLTFVIGTGLIYLWDDWVDLNTHAGYLSMLVSSSAFSFILIDRLSLKKDFPLYYKIIVSIILFYGVMEFFSLFWYNFFQLQDLLPLINTVNSTFYLFPWILLYVCVRVYLKTRETMALNLVLIFQFTFITYFLFSLVPLGVFSFEVYSKFKWFHPIEGFILLFVLISDLFLAKQQKIELQKQLLVEKSSNTSTYLNGQREERKRLAEQLHDSLSLRLGSLKLSLSHSNGGSTNKKAVEDIDRLSEDVRRISHSLSPLTLERKGLIAAINEEIFNIEATHEDIIIDFKYPKDFYDPPKGHIETLYFSTLELLQNILKYSTAENIIVSLSYEENELALTTADDGKKYQINGQSNSGIGLYNIKSRCEILGGSFTISPNPLKGMLHEVKLPWTGA